jgi:hypothetical protein
LRSLTLQHAFFPVCSFLLMFALVFVGCGQARPEQQPAS